MTSINIISFNYEIDLLILIKDKRKIIIQGFILEILILMGFVDN